MATIIKTVDQIKQYVSVNENMEWESILPYTKTAERKYIKALVGSAMYKTYAEYTNDVPDDENIKAVYALLEEASSNLAWFLYLPTANVQITDSGISVVNSEFSKAAEWWQIRDLRRSFIDAGFSAIDDALKIMEATEGVTFSEWKGAEGYTIFRELFVDRTDTFNRWFNISNSRRTFLALRPYMLEVHHQFFTSKLDIATVAMLNNTTKPPQNLPDPLGEGIKYQVLEWLQAAQVNYTVYKAVNSGTFELTANGIYEKIEEFPGYRTKNLDDAQLHRIKNDRLTAAEEYYKKALKMIEESPDQFPDYVRKENAQFVKPKNTGSIVSF